MVSSRSKKRLCKLATAVLIGATLIYVTSIQSFFVQMQTQAPLTPSSHSLKEVTNARYLTFGTSVTWGSGFTHIDDRFKYAYPYLLSPHVKNLAIRASGAMYPSLCTQSLTSGGDDDNNDDDAVYDVIVLEYFRRMNDEGAGLEILIQRLRQRYPNALMIFVQDWYPNLFKKNQADKELHQRLDLQQNMHGDQRINLQQWANMHGSKSPTDEMFRTQFEREDHNKWVSIFDFERLTEEYRAFAQSVGGYVLELPRPDSVKEITEYMEYFAEDWMHLSAYGHAQVANLIHELVSEVGLPPQHSNVINPWSYNDECHNWLDTGDVPYEFSGDAFVENFKKNGKYAITFPYNKSKKNRNNNGGILKIVNRFDKPQKLYLTFMTTGPPPTMYPRAKITVMEQQQQQNSEYTVTLDLTLDWIGPNVHTTLTKYIGVVSPGDIILKIQPLEESELPLRLVSLALNGADHEDTSFVMDAVTLH